MKKTAFPIILMLLLINFNVKGQESSTEFGMKAGVNFAKYSGTLVGANYQGKLGFYAGGFVNFGISEKFKIQPEVLFALQGSNFLIKDMEIRDGSGDIPKVGDFKTRTTETTISIPIVAQYYVADRFYLEAGPQAGIILDSKGKVIKSPTDDPNFNNTVDFDHDVFDLGIALGAGYLLNEKIALNFRYFLGLIGRNTLDVKSSVLNLGLDYKF